MINFSVFFVSSDSQYIVVITFVVKPVIPPIYLEVLTLCDNLNNHRFSDISFSGLA